MRFQPFGWIASLAVLSGSFLYAADPVDFNADDLVRFDVRATFDPLLSDDVYLEAGGLLRGVIWLRPSSREGGPTVPAEGARVFLFQGDRLVDQAVVAKDGRFALNAGKPGEYQLASEFTPLLKLGEAKGLKSNPIREVAFQKADEPEAGKAEPKTGKTEPKAGKTEPRNPLADPTPKFPLDPKVDPKNPGAVAPELPDPLKPVEDETPIGTPPNGNASVFLDNDGSFRFLGAKEIVHHASNDQVFLDKTGNFRGVATYLDKDVVRRPLVGANVYLVQKGEVVAQAVSVKNGSFLLGPVDPGSYSIVAEYGYHTLDSLKNGEGNGNGGNGNGKGDPTFQGVKLGKSNTSKSTTKSTTKTGKSNTSKSNTKAAPVAPVIAWDREKAGLPWQDGAGQLALQRIAVRPHDKAVKLGPVTERTRAGAPAIVQVKFQQNIDSLPVLHMSPSPWTSSAVEMLSASAGAGGGGAAAAAGGGGGAAAAGGGFLVPPFAPSTTNTDPASPF